MSNIKLDIPYTEVLHDGDNLTILELENGEIVTITSEEAAPGDTDVHIKMSNSKSHV